MYVKFFLSVLFHIVWERIKRFEQDFTRFAFLTPWPHLLVLLINGAGGFPLHGIGILFRQGEKERNKLLFLL